MSDKKPSEPSPEESKKLYEVAGRVKELAPWQWMEESQIFGVKNPETGEIGFVSIMGMGGEHFAISVYRGSEGLYGFWDLAEAGPDVDPHMLLEIPQLQASFEDRAETSKRDRDLMKQLGLKFRGAKAWPLFRSYTSGYMPWYLTAEETRFLTYALEQTLEVAPRVKSDPDLLWGEDDAEDGDYLVRVAQEETGASVWADQMMPASEPEPPQVQILMDMGTLTTLRNLPPSTLELEVDFFNMPTPVQEKGGRPYFPAMLLMVDGTMGVILGFAMMPPAETRELLWGQVPMEIVRKLADLSARPKEIRVASPVLANLLVPVGRELNCPIHLVDQLFRLEQARSEIFQISGGLW
ncbi:MAG: hypothetical protein JST84_30090 [Acidobacteria bacterium]|nr:hypothetical protein [Acidobacteriota bacterium]